MMMHMDDQVLPLLTGGLVMALTTAILMVFYKHRSHFTRANLPPGKIGYPVVGETMRWLSCGWKGNPEKFIFDRMTQFNTEIFRTSLVGEPTAVFCGAACNKFLFSNENKLLTTWWPSSINKMFPSTPETMSIREEGKKLRKLLPDFMKPDALQRYIAVMDTIAQRCFVADWENQTEIQTLKLTKRYTFWLAAKLFISMDDLKEITKLEDSFKLLAAGIISMPIDLPGTPFRKAINASNFIRAELIKIIKQRRLDLADGSSTHSQDILSHMLLVSTEEGFNMSELHIADKILALLIGGHDTTSSACTFIVKYLAELPHVYDAVYKEQMDIARTKAEGELLTWKDLQNMKYSWNVAQEVMRVVPPLQGAFREALTDFVFKGYSIPKGWKLYWSTNSTHKSAKYFPDPEKFDPTRFEGNGPAPYTFVPFGGGPRMCPGKEYARLEILVFMHNLVRRFRFEKIVPNEGIVVNPLPMPTNGLPIRLFTHTRTT